MKGHVTKNILIDYIQDDINVRRATAVRQHIDTCDLCRKNFSILKKVAAPSQGKKIKPARSVLTGILDYYDNHDRQSRACAGAAPSQVQIRGNSPWRGLRLRAHLHPALPAAV